MTSKTISLLLAHLVLLLIVLFSGCASTVKVKVYEKLPQFKECVKFTNYNEVTVCNEKEMKKQSAELKKVLIDSKLRLERVHNQADRCAYRKTPPLPASCSVSIIPRRGTFPSIGQRYE